MRKSNGVFALSLLAGVIAILTMFMFASGTKSKPRISESTSTEIPEATRVEPPAVSEKSANPDLAWVRGALRANSTAEGLTRVGTVARSHPASLIEVIKDPSLEQYARKRATQVLVREVSDENLRLVSSLLVYPVPMEIKKTLLEGLVERDARSLKTEILSVMKEYSGDARDGRAVIELALRVWTAMPSPDGDSARTLQGYVEQARESRPRMRDLLEMVGASTSSEPVLAAAAVDLMVAKWPETNMDEINAKNRFVAELMMDSSDAAATVLESIAMGTSGRHAKTQAIQALGNEPRPRNGEILLRVIQKNPDLQLANEAAYVLRRVKGLSPESGLAALNAMMNDGLAEVSVTLAASLLEALERHQRSHELIAAALEVASRFKDTGGIRVRELKLHLAEYAPDPVKTLQELYAAVGWRILNSSAIQHTHLPGMTDLLVAVFQNKETPVSRRIHAATLVGKAGALEKISDGVFALLDESKRVQEWEGLAKLIKSSGRKVDKDRLNDFIDGLPQSHKRAVLERAAAD